MAFLLIWMFVACKIVTSIFLIQTHGPVDQTFKLFVAVSLLGLPHVGVA